MASIEDSAASLRALAPRLRDGIALSINAHTSDPCFFLASYLLRTSSIPVGPVADQLDSSACPLESVLKSRPFDALSTSESIPVDGLSVSLHPDTIAAREQARDNASMWVLKYGRNGVAMDVRESNKIHPK